MNKQNAEVMLPAETLPYVDEVPRFWFSRRWRLAFLGFVGFLIVNCQRISIEVAIVAMLNQTTMMTTMDGSGSVAEDADLSRSYWATRLGMPVHGPSTTVVDSHNPGAKEEFALAYYGGENESSGPDAEGSKSTTKTTKSHNDNETAKTKMEPKCSNATELDILNTTFFTLKSKGDISWTLTEQSGVLDAFYWGDLLIRIPSAFLSQRYGGKRIFGFSILVSSICTAVIPITSRVHYFAVILLRFVTGASAGATVPALSYLFGKWCPADERCLIQSIANTGTGVSGAVISVPIVGLLCNYGFDGGWPSAFYISGGLGMLWSIIWLLLAHDSPNDDTGISTQERDYINSTIHFRSADLRLSNDEGIYRWEVLLTSLPLLALAVNHFTHEWVVCTLTKVIPIYLTDVLHMDFKQNSIGTLVLPSVGFWCVMTVSAGAADRLQAYGVLGANKIRKLMQTVGAVLTAAMMSSVLLMDCYHHLATLFLVTIGLSFCGLQYSGALVAHLDLAPDYAGVTMGMASTLGVSVYFVIPALIRMVVHSSTQSIELKWRILLLLTASCHIFSSLLFLLFGSTGSNSNWSVVDHLTSEDRITTEDELGSAAKPNIDNDVNFDPSSLNSYGYLANRQIHPPHSLHHRLHQHHHPHQQPSLVKNQGEDIYHEALDADAADVDTDSSNRSAVTNGRLQRQASDDSDSNSCVSAASEISEAFHSSNNRSSNILNRIGTTAETEDHKHSNGPAVAAAAVVLIPNDMSESIV